MLSATFDPNKMSAFIHAPFETMAVATAMPTTTMPMPPMTAPRARSATSYLPWLLGAGALAYLIFFRKK